MPSELLKKMKKMLFGSEALEKAAGTYKSDKPAQPKANLPIAAVAEKMATEKQKKQKAKVANGTY